MTPKELAELDLAVAKAEGYETEIKSNKYATICVANYRKPDYLELYQPTRDGAEAMRLLEKYLLHLGYDSGWWALSHDGVTRRSLAPTPAIAICRAVVALKEKTK